MYSGKSGYVTLDVENLYYWIKDHIDPLQALEAFEVFLPRLISGISATTGGAFDGGDAVGDFSRMPAEMPGILGQSGLVMRTVPGQPSKSTAEVAAGILLTDRLRDRPSTAVVVIGSGDGDVAPMVERARQAGAEVWLVAFEANTNRHLAALVGADHYISAEQFLPDTFPTAWSGGVDEPTASRPDLATLTSRQGAPPVDLAQVILSVTINDFVLRYQQTAAPIASVMDRITLRHPTVERSDIAKGISQLEVHGALVVERVPSHRDVSRTAAMIVPNPRHPDVAEALNGRPWPAQSAAQRPQDSAAA
jgi:hypothetical protein